MADDPRPPDAERIAANLAEQLDANPDHGTNRVTEADKMADAIRNRLAQVYGHGWPSVEVTAILALADEIDRRFDKIEARMTNGGL